MVLGHSTFLKRPDDHWQGEEVVVVLYAGGIPGPLSSMIYRLKTFQNGDFYSNLKLPEGSHHYSVKMGTICRYTDILNMFSHIADGYGSYGLAGDGPGLVWIDFIILCPESVP